jgi:hypothetical protein
MASEGRYFPQVIWSDSLPIVKVATLTMAGLKMRSRGPPLNFRPQLWGTVSCNFPLVFANK